MARRAKRRGKGKRDIGWSAAEDGLLRDHYPDYQALREHLPHRTLSALKHRVRAIGIVARRHVWTNIEVARLRKAYADGMTDRELVVLFLGLRLCQIKSKASHIRAERRGPRPAYFGEPALDAIRTRSKAMQLSFVELDRRARTGRFFQKSSRRPSLKPIVRAARFLDAEVGIEWAGDI
ncbi:hypothetical protein [Sphingopyxis sp.]|jgi:hypothetical protein|uniref:hypothetical protein n=1 Tax=Sphingomonadales TaxID=204457 RepID=UPI003F72CC96